MSSSAWLMLVIAEAVIAAFTGYFFWKALKTPPKPEPDSFLDNDDIKR
ncbi:MAG: hypothetical protein KKH28_02350 [Elusimicrobia bacterium]|nr:hypothetical protein [Elusimicrobiota bacterium]